MCSSDLEIISEAKAQAKAIKDRAMNEGFVEGHSRGYRKGIEESAKEGENIKEKAILVLAQCEQEAEDYFELYKNKIIKLAGDMANTIVNHEINTNDETLMDMIKPIIEDYKRSGMVVISCSSSHQKLLPSTSNQYNTMLLKVVSFTWDIACYLDTVGQTNPGNLTKS